MVLNYITVIVYKTLFLAHIQCRTWYLQWNMVCIRTYITCERGGEWAISTAIDAIRPRLEAENVDAPLRTTRFRTRRAKRPSPTPFSG